MSVQAITWALKKQTEPGAKLLLLVLANYANDEGRCYPARKKLAEECCVSERTIRNYIELLEAQEFLTVQPQYDANGRQTTNTIFLALPGEGAESARGGADFGGVHKTTPTGVQIAAPLMNRQIEPSERDTARADEPLEAFNQFCEVADKANLRKPQDLTPERRRHLEKRLKECGGLSGWTAAMDKLAASSFLTGKKTDFRATFDFVLQKSSFRKLMEGNYDDREPSFTSKSSAKPNRADEARAAADSVRQKLGIAPKGSLHGERSASQDGFD